VTGPEKVAVDASVSFKLFVEELGGVARALDKLSLDLRPLRGDLSERCVENALRYGISVNDASYLSLGELEGVPVFTAEARLIKKVGGDVLKHLSSYGSV